MPIPGIHPLSYCGGKPESRVWHAVPDAVNHGVQIDPSARIEPFATVDGGTQAPTVVGPRSWCFRHSHVGHDAQIGADVEISTGAVIGGHAIVEDGARVGLNATVLPFKRIGKGARVGAGAVVTKDVEPGDVVVGVPARSLVSVS